MASAETLRLSGSEAAPRWRGRLHLGALVVGAPASVALVVHDPDPPVLVYAVALVATFAVSSAYHLGNVDPGRRSRLRRADHALIYAYIAACYTPFCLVGLPDRLGLTLLAVVWAGAAVGMAVKLVGFERTRVLSGVLYIVVGWAGVFTLPRTVHHLDALELGLTVATGLLYTAGACVLCFRRPDPRPDTFGYHEVWHAAVVVASACYFVVVWTLPVHG